jgi:glycosyltransferase involved in cell wall biosynthesis
VTGKKVDVVQVGSYPPPYGGVSTHIQRLHDKLLNFGNSSFVYNMSSNVYGETNVINMKLFSSWINILNLKPTLIHFHTGSGYLLWLAIFYVMAKIKNSKLIISYHSFRDDISKYGNTYSRILKKVYSFCDQIVVVNSDIKMKLVHLDVDVNKISIIPAFIPPAISKHRTSRLPPDILDYATSHFPLLSSYAYTLKTNDSTINIEESVDLYGIDVIIDLIATLKANFPKIGLVLCITYKNDMSYFDEILEKIESAGITENILIYDRPISNLFELWKLSHVYIRATLSDGDSVALREALWFDTPVVASDVVVRPIGVITYHSGDQRDLVNKVMDVLNNSGNSKKRQLSTVGNDDNYCSIMGIYGK